MKNARFIYKAKIIYHNQSQRLTERHAKRA